MAKITNFRSFLLVRISVLRVELGEARTTYRRMKSGRVISSGVGESKKWKLEAELDGDKTLQRFERACDELAGAVSIMESWSEGLEAKLSVLSREITIRQQDFGGFAKGRHA